MKKRTTAKAPAKTTADKFERLVVQRKRTSRYQLQLFITGMTPRSTEAIATIKGICDELLPGKYDLEIVDLYEHPERARDEDVIAAPTLVKQLPLPRRRLIGSLAFRERIVKALDLAGVS